MNKPFLALASSILLSQHTFAAPSDDLVAYWDLDNNTIDSAPGGTSTDNGLWIGGAEYATAGQFGNAAQLTGSNHISIPSSNDLAHPGGNITISAWFTADSFDTSWQALISKGEGTNYRIARRGSDNQQIAYAGGSGDISGGGVNDGLWHHVIAISEAGSNTFLYIDGVLVATGASPSLTDSGLPLLIGENPVNTNRRWNGKIDDVSLFDSALNDFQVKAIYNLGKLYSYPMADVVRILDAHVAGPGGSTQVGEVTWNYAASDTGSGDFILLGTDGSGVDRTIGPAITVFGSTPTFISSGNTATLSWQITPPFTGVVIDNGIGNVLPQTNASGTGSVTVSPTASTSYTITTTGPNGTSTRSTTLFVDVDPSIPRINEFSADTATTGLLDEDGANEDWIEIYNPGPTVADLSTFHLTDNALLLNKWSFPAIVMQPDSYLVVFASGKDRTIPGNELHTNFKLGAKGEYLALTRDGDNGTFVATNEFSPEYPEQEEGFSYGLNPNGLSLGFFNTPTPGTLNGVSFEGFVADTMFDVDRGFFESSFPLTITTETPGATIRYTTNGSEPSLTNGTTYNGPITISSTTTLRARAFKDGFQPTNIDTHTYFFLEDVRTQFANGAAPSGWPVGSVNGQVFNYGMDPDITNMLTPQEMIDALSAIPSVSITTTQANLTSSSTGIYTHPNSRGRSWERPASIEFIHPDGATPNVQSGCGIRIRGGFSRSPDNPKHAFRIFFRKEYGAGKFNYPLFGNEGVDSFEKFDLRTSQNYSWSFQGDSQNTFLREVLGRDLQGRFGEENTKSRYYHLYLNGVYWGLFMTQERAEANHGESYFGGDDSEYDTLKSSGRSGGYITEATDGSFAVGSDWSVFWQMARDQKAAPTIDRFMEMQGLNPDGSRNESLPVYLDLDNLITYQMIIGYTGNYDAPLSDFVDASNNWYAIRNRESDDLGFQFFVHDGEHSMGAGGKWIGANDRINTPNGAEDRPFYNRSNPSFIHLDLEESTPEYRLRFADRAHDALFNDGLLTKDQVFATFEKRRVIVDQVIDAEAARWGDAKRSSPLRRINWQSEVTSVQNLMNTRSETFLGHLRIANLYPDLDAPIYSQHGGQIAAGSSITASIPVDATAFYYMIGSGDPDTTDWQDALDPRLLGGMPNPNASMIAAGDGDGIAITSYVNSGNLWKYLADGSDQGTAWREVGFDDSSWDEGISELGYGDGDEATEIPSGGFGSRYATSYFRKTIDIPDPAIFGDFAMEVTYDDAFVVYVNGIEVGRSDGLSANPTFDEYSTNMVENNATLTLLLPPSTFQTGSNLIAVEMHQNGAGSSDVSFDLDLKGRPAGGSPGIIVMIPEAIDGPIWIKSRSYNSATGEWSALNSAFFTTAPNATSMDIVISEVHYHPTDPTMAELAVDPTFDQDDFEFIEVLNRGTNTVDLGNAAFIEIPIGDHLEGIRHTFAQGTLIAPGQRLIVAANSAAFAARYPGVTISGDYSGRLDNTGEWITLVDATGNVIDSFRYNDTAPWPLDADGLGPSLIRNSAVDDLDPSDPLNWSASPTTGGSPGSSDGFTGDPLADLDGDGNSAILEYAQGLSDNVSSVEQFATYTEVMVGGVAYPGLSFRQDPFASDVTLFIETSANLKTPWTDVTASGDAVFVETVNDPDGIPRHTYRLSNSLQSSGHQFIRLGVRF